MKLTLIYCLTLLVFILGGCGHPPPVLKWWIHGAAYQYHQPYVMKGTPYTGRVIRMENTSDSDFDAQDNLRAYPRKEADYETNHPEFDSDGANNSLPPKHFDYKYSVLLDEAITDTTKHVNTNNILVFSDTMYSPGDCVTVYIVDGLVEGMTDRTNCYDKNAEPFPGKIILKEKAIDADFAVTDNPNVAPHEKSDFKYTVLLEDKRKVIAFSDFSYQNEDCVTVFMRSQWVSGITGRSCQ